jgi:PIN domain nuclease of toxin-antitoxin system
MDRLLLDTCAVLWLANGDELDKEARARIAEGVLHVSPISAWEIGNLVRKGRIGLAMPTASWFRQAIDRMQAFTPSLSIEVLVESCQLPGNLAGDPADRIIIATAREHELIVITRDEAILRYSGFGHVRAMKC